MTRAMPSVGTTMSRPSGRHTMHQAISFSSQKRMCVFSIFRYEAGMTYTSGVAAVSEAAMGRAKAQKQGR